MIKDDLEGKRVYLDSGMFIYLIAGFKFSEALNDLKDMIAKKEIEISFGEYSYSEVLLYCIRNEEEENKDTRFDEIADFLGKFEAKDASAKIGNDAGSFGGKNGIDPLSSIHVMSAVANKCDVFLTSDPKIKSVPDGLTLVFFPNYKNTMDQNLAL